MKSCSNLSSCCQSTFQADPCPKHSEQQVKFICTDPKCHQVLCESCLSDHKIVHKKQLLPEMKLTHLEQISEFYKAENKQELQELNARKSEKCEKPQELMMEIIDQFLYGTVDRRKILLQENAEQMKNRVDTGLLMKLLQQDNGFSLREGFKERYFSFLDYLFNRMLTED